MKRIDLWLDEWLKIKEGPDDYSCALFAIICWEIWKSRCQFVFEGKEVDAIGCVGRAMRMVCDFWDADNDKKRRRVSETGVERNNVDAAFCKERGKAAVGLVARDDKGGFVGGLGKKINADLVFIAESMTVMEALNSYDRIGNCEVIVETDCQVLFDKLQKKEVKGCEWGCEDILQKCISMLQARQNWHLSLVARNGNKAADLMAADAMRSMVPKGWLCEPPPSLESVLYLDVTNSHEDVGERSGIG
ncbi:uncharacterized protein LOC114752972 [Neltuma alba]|uniref:uncharacterized protein LOC114752972 n=1 Tax=Neltuma alba TaxID=207710 RepID=UPI0010A40C2F|nr:uncharacterized protein LOC114752972 [Prosopis alba]